MNITVWSLFKCFMISLSRWNVEDMLKIGPKTSIRHNEVNHKMKRSLSEVLLYRDRSLRHDETNKRMYVLIRAIHFRQYT